MQDILIAGGGKIGMLIALLLAKTGDYQVLVADTHKIKSDNFKTIILDLNDQAALKKVIIDKKLQIVISCLPYYLNEKVAITAKECDIHYFDLTEDINVAATIQKLAANSNKVFVPQCGLAPGFISIVTNHLMKSFESLDKALMRVGALPQNPNNTLKYALTWSTDGLINEYANVCTGIENGQLVNLQPLEGLETLELDGLIYEAFNTSGGLGTLTQSYQDQINTMNYKTIRYPGHCEKIRFLMQDLKLADNRELLKHILENALPQTEQDVVVIYASVSGYNNHQLFEKNYVKKIYSQYLEDQHWSAIQLATAHSACAVMEIVLKKSSVFKGMVLQENITLNEFLNNRFGAFFEN